MSANSIDALIGALCVSLRADVLPELTSDHARSQLTGTLDILAKLQVMCDWSASMQCEEQEMLERGIRAVTQHALASSITPALVAPSGGLECDETECGEKLAAMPGETQGATLGEPLLETQARMRELIDWLFDAPMPPVLREELHALLRPILHEQVAAQRRRIPRADFSSMTASSHASDTDA